MALTVHNHLEEPLGKKPTLRSAKWLYHISLDDI